MNYPAVYRTYMTGEQLKTILEDVCDNLFNPNPYYQQGGDMVRLGGVSYECAPKELIGKRIRNMVISKNWRTPRTWKEIYCWRLGIGKSQNDGAPIYDVLEDYITRKKLFGPLVPITLKLLAYRSYTISSYYNKKGQPFGCPFVICNKA